MGDVEESVRKVDGSSFLTRVFEDEVRTTT